MITAPKSEDFQCGCPLNNLSEGDVDPRCGIPQAEEVSLPQSRPVEVHIGGIQKTQVEWNGAGTFGFLVTLKKHERCERRRSRAARLSWRTDYD